MNTPDTREISETPATGTGHATHTTSDGAADELVRFTDEPLLARQTRLRMGMPVTVAIALDDATPEAHAQARQSIARVYDYFAWVDATFSPFRETSEVSRLNRGEFAPEEASAALSQVLLLAEKTRQETQGFFDIARPDGSIDPSGLVKGWAIARAAERLAREDWRNYAVDAGGDIQVAGTKDGQPWRVGIRNPFNRDENVKILALTDHGIATSGTATRGQHIYNPHHPDASLDEIISLTVVAPSVYDADRIATAAFAMGRRGINFIASLHGYAGYVVDATGHATYTSGLERYLVCP